jgi:cytochrome c
MKFTASLSAMLLLPCAVLFCVPVYASADLAQKKNCMSCHSVARKIVGPAFKDVAAKYAGQTNAVDALTQKVLHGGSGVWGAMVMPAMKNAHPAVSEADAKVLVQWVLSQK